MVLFETDNVSKLIATLEANCIDTDKLSKQYVKNQLLMRHEYEKVVKKLTTLEENLNIVRQDSILNRVSLISANQNLKKDYEHINDRQNKTEEIVKNDKEIINNKINQIQQLSEKNYTTLHNKINELTKKLLSEDQVPVIKPRLGEEKILADILGTKFQELKNTAGCVDKKKKETLANQVITKAIEACKLFGANNSIIESINDICFEDLEKLIAEFLSLLENSSSITSMLGKFIKVGCAVYGIGKVIYKSAEKAQIELIKEEQYKIQANDLMTSLIRMTVDETKTSFDKATHVFLARYYATYNFHGVLYSNNMRTYSSIKNYKEHFFFESLLSEKIDSQRQILVNLKIDDDIPCSCKSYNDYLHYIGKKNYLTYVKDEKIMEFAIKHKLYRAYLKLGEFDVISECGDRNKISKTLACTATIPILGVGAVVGIGFGIKRMKNEQKWSQNVHRLKEVMKKHLIIDTNFEQVAEKLYTLEKLQYYVDVTKSQYGNELLKKNLEELRSEFRNEFSKKKFTEAFDLYQKITHTGIADRENYIHLNIDYVSPQDDAKVMSPLDHQDNLDLKNDFVENYF